MTDHEALHAFARQARALSAELVTLRNSASQMMSAPANPQLAEGEPIEAQFDRRVKDANLRVATRSRFLAGHYADAVEAGVKTLCDCVRTRSGRIDDGDSLMSHAFSPNSPLLRVNAGKSKSDESEQRGHMLLCQGVIGAWRNPRAHTLVDDSPERALMMLETMDSLISTTRLATRTRKRKLK